MTSIASAEVSAALAARRARSAATTVGSIGQRMHGDLLDATYAQRAPRARKSNALFRPRRAALRYGSVRWREIGRKICRSDSTAISGGIARGRGNCWHRPD